MFIINKEDQFTTSHGVGLSFMDTTWLGTWGLHKKIKIETPVKIGLSQLDVGGIGAFSIINLRKVPHITTNTIIEASSIGRFCIIASGVTIGLPEHSINFLSSHPLFRDWNKMTWCNNFYSSKENTRWQEEMREKCLDSYVDKRRLPVIGNDVWIGYHAIVLNGVTIGDGAVIGGGGVITKDVEPYTIVGGVPAKPIKKRFKEKTIEKLVKLQWWKYGPDILLGLDLAHPDEMIDELEERIENGFPEYHPEIVEFDIVENTISQY